MATVFSTTFADAFCPAWVNNGLNGDPCQPADGIGEYGGWSSDIGNYSQITVDANYSGGGGGRGYRMIRGNGGTGQNDGGSGVAITLPTPLSEIWVRYYARYQSGFRWFNNNPDYIKENYWENGHVFGPYGPGSTWGIATAGPVYAGNISFQDTMPGGIGDGVWHLYEYHLKQNGTSGTAEFWIDNVYAGGNVGSANLGSTLYNWFIFPSNQNKVVDTANKAVDDGGTPTDWYVDFDDIAISDSGRIGPLSAGGSAIALDSGGKRGARMLGLVPQGYR
jgi:hypothetical protein